MEKDPLISIVVAFLNAEKFLDQTIESVLAQTYTHWELILMDDGSTDNSTAIARQYAHRYPPKIFYLEHKGHENKGVCASRNTAINQSKGEYIAILDSDDVWHPEKIKAQLGILLEYPEAGMVCGAYEYWYSWDAAHSNKDHVVAVGGPQDQVTKSPLLLTCLYPLGEGAAPCPSDILIRRFVYENFAQFEAGIFMGDYQFYEDQAFLCKIYFNVPVYISSKCYLRYRQRPDSLVAIAYRKGKYHDARRFFLQWFKEYAKAHQLNDRRIRKAYKKAIAVYRPHKILYYKLKNKLFGIVYPLLKKSRDLVKVIGSVIGTS